MGYIFFDSPCIKVYMCKILIRCRRSPDNC